MGAYKLIEVTKTSERESQSIYDHDNLKTATAALNNDFGNILKQDGVLETYCVLIDQNDGTMIDRLYWGYNDHGDGSQKYSDVLIRDRVYTHNDYAEDNISAYESEQLAVANFHTKYASALNKAECNFAIVIRFDYQGIIRNFKKYVAEESVEDN